MSRFAVAAAWVAISGFFFVDTTGSLVFAALAASGAALVWREDGRAALYAGVAAAVALLCAAPMVRMLWPAPALVALGLGALVSRRSLPGTGAWWRRGHIRPQDWGIAAV